MGTRSEHVRFDLAPDRPDARSMHKYAAPVIDLTRAREAWDVSRELQEHATHLDPDHRRRVRRARRARKSRQTLMFALLLVVALAAWRYVPFGDIWQDVQDASAGRIN